MKSSQRQGAEQKPDYTQLAQWDKDYIWHPFTQMQMWNADNSLIIERGEGSYLVPLEQVPLRNYMFA